jgi:hypothetical protein
VRRGVNLGAALLLLLGGCAVTYSTDMPPNPVSPAAFDQPVYLTSRPMSIPREYLYRYSCPTNQALLCDCTGRVAKSCLCRC